MHVSIKKICDPSVERPPWSGHRGAVLVDRPPVERPAWSADGRQVLDALPNLFQVEVDVANLGQCVVDWQVNLWDAV